MKLLTAALQLANASTVLGVMSQTLKFFVVVRPVENLRYAQLV